VTEKLSIIFQFCRSFLGEILPLIQSKSQALDDLMEEHNLLAFPTDEELWEVREPYVAVLHPQPGMQLSSKSLHLHILQLLYRLTFNFYMIIHTYGLT